jgi:hypothetical protein
MQQLADDVSAFHARLLLQMTPAAVALALASEYVKSHVQNLMIERLQKRQDDDKWRDGNHER